MTENDKKKKNYFSDFGFRQVCDITLLTAAIVLIIGLFVDPVWVILTGLSLFIVGSVMAGVRTVLILTRGAGKSSPEFRNAVINIVIMSVVFALSVFMLIYTCVNL